MAKRRMYRHRSVQERRELVLGQAGSGLSIAAWCRRQGLTESAFYRWRGELARQQTHQAPPAFVPVRVQADAPAEQTARMEILLAGGRTVRLSGPVDRRMLAEVLAALEGQPC